VEKLLPGLAPTGGAHRAPLHAGPTLFDLLGTLVWLAGFLFEAAGDAQLLRFKRDGANAGRLLRTGLWAYSRHPNLFGDAMLWWGFFLIALGTPYGWATLYAPLFMTYSLLKVSGVALQEKTLAASRPGYAEYMRATPAFVPWFPRRRLSS